MAEIPMTKTWIDQLFLLNANEHRNSYEPFLSIRKLIPVALSHSIFIFWLLVWWWLLFVCVFTSINGHSEQCFERRKRIHNLSKLVKFEIRFKCEFYDVFEMIRNGTVNTLCVRHIFFLVTNIGSFRIKIVFTERNSFRLFSQTSSKRSNWFDVGKH